MGEEVGVEWTDSSATMANGGEEALMRVRPMALCLNKEIRYFNEKKGLRSLLMKRPEDGLEPRVAGIESLVSGESFFLGCLLVRVLLLIPFLSV